MHYPGLLLKPASLDGYAHQLLLRYNALLPLKRP